MSRHMVIVTRVAEGAKMLANELGAAGNAKLADVPSPEWVEHRAQLLEHVTAAALRKVNAPFTWVWRAHPDRAAQVQAIAERVWPTALVIADGALCDPAVAPGCERFVVIRLDADDALAPLAVDRLASTDLKPGTLVNWSAGWKLNWSTGQLRPCGWPLRHQGPFLAMTQDRRAQMFDVRSDHTYAREGRPRIVHIEGRNWIWTYHGQNMLNRWPGSRWVDDELPMKDARRILDGIGVR